jgi:hypothetical protein
MALFLLEADHVLLSVAGQAYPWVQFAKRKFVGPPVARTEAPADEWSIMTYRTWQTCDWQLPVVHQTPRIAFFRLIHGPLVAGWLRSPTTASQNSSSLNLGLARWQLSGNRCFRFGSLCKSIHSDTYAQFENMCSGLGNRSAGWCEARRWCT